MRTERARSLSGLFPAQRVIRIAAARRVTETDSFVPASSGVAEDP